MKTRSILPAVFLMVTGLQTVWAQKTVIYKSDKTTAKVDSIILVENDSIPTICPDDNHPHAIDLGLPSGTKWCCCNVGANSPEGHGGYFAWGETSEKSMYGWQTYTYGNGKDWENYQFIGSDIAGTKYDVAYVRMGTPWHMPSATHHMELTTNCSYKWTQRNGVNGIILTGPNGGQIFLPAAGGSWYEIFGVGDCGGYWSSSCYPDITFASYMFFSSENLYWNLNCGRHEGHSVRAIRP